MREESPARSRLPLDIVKAPACHPAPSLPWRLCGETSELAAVFPEAVSCLTETRFLLLGTLASSDGHGLLPRKRNAPAVIQFVFPPFVSIPIRKGTFSSIFLHFSFIHKMLTFKAPDTPNFRATGATILVLQVEGTKNRRRKCEIFA